MPNQLDYKPPKPPIQANRVRSLLEDFVRAVLSVLLFVLGIWLLLTWLVDLIDLDS